TESRNLGHRLGPLRDRDVVQGLMHRLERQASSRRRRESVRRANVILAASRSRLVARDHRAEEGVVSAVTSDAENLLDRIEGADFSGVDLCVVLDRCQWLWRRARDRFQSGVDAPDTDWLRETRKRVIRLELGLQPLVTIRPGSLRRSVKTLKRVSNPLSDGLDLAMLDLLLEPRVAVSDEDGTMAGIVREVTHRRNRLRRKALRRGSSAFRRRPREVRKRIEGWWNRF
ncbi:MAG: hypothetical protein CMJ23_03110, partial [Phycisphaerae bacterium]|nr:hypothetical protein [Phycisphaerae bacterium]